MLLSKSVTGGLYTRHWDVSNSFLYGRLEESEYVQMKQPDGLLKKYSPQGIELICLVKRSLYGLKSAPRIWAEVLGTVLQALGFSKSHVNTGNQGDTVGLRR